MTSLALGNVILTLVLGVVVLWLAGPIGRGALWIWRWSLDIWARRSENSTLRRLGRLERRLYGYEEILQDPVRFYAACVHRLARCFISGFAAVIFLIVAMSLDLAVPVSLIAQRVGIAPLFPGSLERYPSLALSLAMAGLLFSAVCCASTLLAIVRLMEFTRPHTYTRQLSERIGRLRKRLCPPPP